MTSSSGLDDVQAERLARVTLSLVFEPGDPRAAKLCAELGARELVDRLRSDRAAADITTDAGTRLPFVEPERDLERAAVMGLRFVIPGDPEWPTCLDGLAAAPPLAERGGPPLGLWVRGARRLDELSDAIAIVGSRAATTYGTDTAARIAGTVATDGWAVISGGAYGVDQAAHRGSMGVGGMTVAVMAHGLDRTYPAGHVDLVDAIAERGLVVSELAPGSAPTRIRFLARNRLIAALARGTVVVEAKVRSGALNTANWTGRLHRPLMGVPGPVTSAFSAGVHALVRSGAATLVTSGDEVLEVVGRVGEHALAEPRAPERVRDRLTVRLQQVLDAVPVGRPAPTDGVARTAGIGIVEAQRGLDKLEQHGLVSFAEGGWRLTDAALAH
ncbi:DNA-processing protein DprA [Nocardioides panacihumi]|uniref:DNA-processing protein DprA n=1 Tax=Nocardioides panacihumi TaxID=400774 RepID=A0ABP5CEM6_9ACTN